MICYYFRHWRGIFEDFFRINSGKAGFFALCGILLLMPVSCGTLPDSGTVALIDGGEVVPRESRRIHLITKGRAAPSFFLSNYELAQGRALNRLERFTLVEENEQLTLMVAIEGFEEQPLEKDRFGVVTKERMKVSATMILIDTVSGGVILKEAGIEAFYVYSREVPPVTSPEAAAGKIGEMLAERIAAKVQTGWYTEQLTPQERGK